MNQVVVCNNLAAIFAFCFIGIFVAGLSWLNCSCYSEFLFPKYLCCNKETLLDIFTQEFRYILTFFYFRFNCAKTIKVD